MKFIQAAEGNFKHGRSKPIEYLVIHYTAGDGDSAEANLRYCANQVRKTSAHYFIDKKECAQSVLDTDTAWHCGADSYRHPACRNANSIGIELCSRIDRNGDYYIEDAVVENAVRFVRGKMREYSIPLSNVVRHYDVTGKLCPMPMVKDETQWHDFLARVAAPEEGQHMPEQTASHYAKEAARWAAERGYIKGNGQGEYAWQNPLTREQFAVILKRFAEANGLQ